MAALVSEGVGVRKRGGGDRFCSVFPEEFIHLFCVYGGMIEKSTEKQKALVHPIQTAR